MAASMYKVEKNVVMMVVGEPTASMGRYLTDREELALLQILPGFDPLALLPHLDSAILRAECLKLAGGSAPLRVTAPETMVSP